MMENFRTDIGEPQVACRTFEQANAELVFQISDSAANGRDRQLEAARSLREAVGLDDLGVDGTWKIARYCFSTTLSARA